MEFQYASTLMPNRAEPLNNLGVVFEAVQKLDDAADRYEQALEINPDQPSVICNLARIYVRRNRKDERTKNLLQQIVLRNPSEQWSTWASERLAVMGVPKLPKPTILRESPNQPLWSELIRHSPKAKANSAGR